MAGADIFDNPMVSVAVVAAVIGVIIYFLFFKNKKDKADFVPQRFEKTVYSEAAKIMKMSGTKIRGGRLCKGYHQIGGSIEAYAEVKGANAVMRHDTKLNRYLEDKTAKPVPYHQLILVSKSRDFLKKLLGVGKEYFVLEPGSVEYNYATKTWTLPDTAEVKPFGNVWTNSAAGMEWISDISLKRTFENTLTHVENFPDKVSHLELAHAKFSSRVRTVAAAEKSKYDAGKNAEDTEIEIK
jgi:hypothetical protein